MAQSLTEAVPSPRLETLADLAHATVDGAGAWESSALDGLSAIDLRLFRLFGEGPVQKVQETHIHHAIEQWAAAIPDAIAIEHAGESITYAGLNGHANRVAAHLVELGVRPGDNVGVFTRRSIPMVVGILGILKAGAAYVPQDVGIVPAALQEHVATTAQLGVVLTSSAYAASASVPRAVHLVAVDSFLASACADDPAADVRPFRLEHPVSGDSGCYVLFTSGTTGRPNGVRVTHRNVCNLLLTQPGDLGIRPGYRVAQILNIGFDMAAWEILGCLSHGGTLLIRGRDIAETVRRAHVVIATPTILGRIDADECRQVKVVAVAGEPCPKPLADRWAEFCTFYNGCGPTEVTIVNTMQRHHPAAPNLTIGRPTPNNTVYVLDENLRPCTIGQVGEMWAGGDCVSEGYLANPDLNAQRYAPDPFLGGGRMMFRTRDLGRWTADGELEHLGRTDDQVKIRGFRVELDSVSAVLEKVPGCRQAVTLTLDDSTLVSFVTPATVDPEAARQAVADALPYYCTPVAVHAMHELPGTGRGKVDKTRLGELARQWAAAAEPVQAVSA